MAGWRDGRGRECGFQKLAVKKEVVNIFKWRRTMVEEVSVSSLEVGRLNVANLVKTIFVVGGKQKMIHYCVVSSSR